MTDSISSNCPSGTKCGKKQRVTSECLNSITGSCRARWNVFNFWYLGYMWIGRVSRVELSRFKAEPTNLRKGCHEFQTGLILWLRAMLDTNTFPLRWPLSIFTIATFQCDFGSLKVEPRCQKREPKCSTTAKCSHTNVVATGSFARVWDRKILLLQDFNTSVLEHRVLLSRSAPDPHPTVFGLFFFFFSLDPGIKNMWGDPRVKCSVTVSRDRIWPPVC